MLYQSPAPKDENDTNENPTLLQQIQDSAIYKTTANFVSEHRTPILVGAGIGLLWAGVDLLTFANDINLAAPLLYPAVMGSGAAAGGLTAAVGSVAYNSGYKKGKKRKASEAELDVPAPEVKQPEAPAKPIVKQDKQATPRFGDFVEQTMEDDAQILTQVENKSPLSVAFNQTLLQPTPKADDTAMAVDTAQAEKKTPATIVMPKTPATVVMPKTPATIVNPKTPKQPSPKAEDTAMVVDTAQAETKTPATIVMPKTPATIVNPNLKQPSPKAADTAMVVETQVQVESKTPATVAISAITKQIDQLEDLDLDLNEDIKTARNFTPGANTNKRQKTSHDLAENKQASTANAIDATQQVSEDNPFFAKPETKVEGRKGSRARKAKQPYTPKL